MPEDNKLIPQFQNLEHRDFLDYIQTMFDDAGLVNDDSVKNYFAVESYADFMKKAKQVYAGAKRFLPTIVGVPRGVGEVMSALEDRGYWVADDVENRDEIIEWIHKIQKLDFKQA